MKLHQQLYVITVIATLIMSACTYVPVQDNASKQLQAGVKQGDAQSQYRMGLLYTNNEPQDYTKAAKWFSKAAHQGNRDAQYMLGINYYVGRGIPRNDVVARTWFQKAADQGHSRAQYQLGEIFMNGRGVKKERAWAARWYGMAAEQGHAQAQVSLGIAFARGLGLPINPVRACQWLMLAERSSAEMAEKLNRVICSKLSTEQQKRAKILADRWRIRSFPVDQDPPTIRYIQLRLQQLGYDPGYVDGVNGEQTRIAVKKYLAKNESKKTVSMSELLTRLRVAS